MSPSLLAIMVLSIVSQFLAAIMAVRLIRLSGVYSAWLLLAGGFILQGVRRAVSLHQALRGHLDADPSVEILGLFISLLLAVGIWKFGAIFSEINRSHQSLSERQEELARINRQMEDEVSQRRAIELMLQESEARYRAVADFSHDWEYWLAPDKTFRYVSPYCQQVCGYDHEEFYRDPKLLPRIVHPEDHALFQAHISEVFADDGNPEPLDFRIITREGEVRWIAHVCRRVVDSDGTYLGQRASNRDITDRKRAECELYEKSALLEKEVAARQEFQERLAAKKQELELLNRDLERRISETVAEIREKDRFMISQNRQAAMGEMIGNIAHQWRQPLNALAVMLANMHDAYRLNALDAASMDQAMNDCNRLIRKMSTTINDFSNFFRPDKERVAFSVLKQVKEAIVLVEPSFTVHNIVINWEQSGDPLVFGFPNEFSQVLVNLLINAKEAILLAASTAGRIDITLEERDGHGGVRISDTGGGIPPETREKIFEPYFTTKNMGTGLGLYMSKVIIERNMNGIITVQNRGDGAEFKVMIPLAPGGAATDVLREETGTAVSVT